MSDAVKELTDGDFEEYTAGGVVLVDFWAPWCAPCLAQAPVIEGLGAKVGDKANIAKINVDENTEAAQKFGVQSIPTLILFKDGAEHKRFVGVQAEADLVQAIEDAQ